MLASQFISQPRLIRLIDRLGGAPFVKNQEPRAFAKYLKKPPYIQHFVVVKISNACTISTMKIQVTICILIKFHIHI